MRDFLLILEIFENLCEIKVAFADYVALDPLSSLKSVALSLSTFILIEFTSPKSSQRFKKSTRDLHQGCKQSIDIFIVILL